MAKKQIASGVTMHLYISGGSSTYLAGNRFLPLCHGVDDHEIMSVVSSGTVASMATLQIARRGKDDVRRCKYVADKKDVVTFAEIGDGKAVEMGYDKETDIVIPSEPRNFAWATYAVSIKINHLSRYEKHCTSHIL
eukprot:scaffold42157_cov29-Cyclotella_meneghiniana.AAC.4